MNGLMLQIQSTEYVFHSAHQAREFFSNGIHTLQHRSFWKVSELVDWQKLPLYELLMVTSLVRSPRFRYYRDNM